MGEAGIENSYSMEFCINEYTYSPQNIVRQTVSLH